MPDPTHTATAPPIDIAADPPLPQTISIEPLRDTSVERDGVDARSNYVETFWLGILGPSTTLLLRHIAARFDASPGGFELDAQQTAQRLGIGHRSGKNSPFNRAILRAVQFNMAQPRGAYRLAVRTKLPRLSARQVANLPDALRTAHEGIGHVSPHREEPDRRAKRLALSLVRLGEEPPAIVGQLIAWRFDPEVAAQAAAWAGVQGSPAAPKPAQHTG